MIDISLRPFTENDITDIVAAANNPKIAQYMVDAFPHPYTTENAAQFVALTKDINAGLRLAICNSDKVIGAIGAHPQSDIFKKNAELGYWLSEEYWGKGIMTEAIKKMIPLAFEQYDITRLFARVYGNNIASQKAVGKAGFVLEAHIKNSLFKNEEFLDELIYGLRQ